MNVGGLKYDYNTPIDELGHSVTKFIEECLNESEGWKVLAESFPSIFSRAEVELLARNASPASRLMYELSTRLCTVGVLANMLQMCRLLMPLYALCQPVPLVITRQPWQNDRSGYSADARDRIMPVQCGSTLTLQCKAEGLPPPVYSWFRDNEELENETGEILEIQRFGPQHVGEYYCRVIQKFPLEGDVKEDSSDPVEVDFLPELPEIVKQPESVTCREGSTAIITFSILESPATKDVHFQWFRSNESLPGCTRKDLEISRVSEAHEGDYRCYIVNNAGELWTDTAKIMVYRPPDMAKEKFALLIGNAEYENLNDLNTPSADVATLSKIFKELQFKVVALKNLTIKEMRNALKHFCQMLPADAYAVFYFVGHGFQLQEKYMLPVDAPSMYLRCECLCESEVIKELYTTHPGLVVIILDMCLRVPDVNENPDIYKEVPPVYEYTPQRNLVQGYATTSNLGAYERSSETNGIYAKHLARALSSCRDCEIVSVLEKVNEGVEREHPDAAEKQMPSVSHNCSRASDFCLSGDVVGDQVATAEYQELTRLPSSPIPLSFKKVDVKAIALLKLHKDTFLNSLDVHIIGAANWNVDFSVQNLELKYDSHQTQEGWLVSIHNLQKLKGELSLSIILKDEHNTKIVDHTLLDLQNVQLICAWQLWHAEGDRASIGVTSACNG